MKDTIKVRPLRPFEKVKLRRLIRQRRNAVNSRNARIVMLSAGRQTNAIIARTVGCSAVWVRQIIHRFNDSGIDGITCPEPNSDRIRSRIKGVWILAC